MDEEDKKIKRKIYDKKYYQKNKDKIYARFTEYRKKNQEKFNERQKKYFLKHREEIKERIKIKQKHQRELLIKKELLTDCIICGFPKEKFAAISFHHINPEEKEKLIGQLIGSTTDEKLVKEVSKCVCMCFNCHMLYHGGDEEVIEKLEKYIKEHEDEYNQHISE